METEEMKKCSYCAELIQAEAIKCRYCGSSLTSRNSGPNPDSSLQYWRRVKEGKKIAGVCTGIARQFDSPILILPLRVVFIATTFLWLFGLVFYIVLWILMPAPEDTVERVRMENTSSTGDGKACPPPPASGDAAEGMTGGTAAP